MPKRRARRPATRDGCRRVVSAFDIGAKNPARTVLEVSGDSVRVLDVSKLDWSADWESRVARDVAAFDADTVLLETQPRGSPHARFVYFIRGVLHGNRRVLCVAPAMRGNSYRWRKRVSVRRFLSWMDMFGLRDSVPDRRKLDDVADSFNIAMRFVLTRL
ncbi:Holliday protein resolvase [Squirrelpox virus]|uniref:Holliday protein resolvase n=1 Tax=Squirrelpox virus TaxID=240426 RepID=U3UBK8_9POXV|nr:Holliday protein resolvase [Squirrelpox virus]CCD83294.1 Holliday protein resolvase [Squirrelpox virus]